VAGFYDNQSRGGIYLVGNAALGGHDQAMPSGRMTRDQGAVQMGKYTVSHEYGHMLNYTTQPSGHGAMYKELQSQPKNGGMSRYGMTNSREAYAEAFAHYSMTGGAAPNVATQAYAERYGWQSP
jgi:hypothetical protein